MGAIMKGAKKRKKTGASPEWTKMRKKLSFVESLRPLKSKTLTISGSPTPKKREVIIKKPSTTKLADTWQGRRIDAMNRKIRRRKGTVDKYIDEHGATSASKAPTKKVYKSVQKKWHSLTPDQQSEVYMKKAKRTPGNIHFDKKKFGKK